MIAEHDNRGASLDEPIRSMLTGLSSVHPLIIALDDQFRVHWITDRLDLLGGRACEFIGRSAEDLREGLERPGDDDTRRLRIRAFIELMTSPEPNASTRIGAGLHEDPLEVCSFDTIDAAGDRIRVLIAGRRVIARDSTATRTLEKKNAELETYMRGVSHDLRSPLVSVLGFTRLLREDFGDPLGRTGRHFLDRIEQAGRHMERLLHDLRELSRIDEAPQYPVHVDPLPVLRQLAAELKLQLDEAGIELHLPNEAPTLVCDLTRLYQLFSNLIGNAISHMQPNTSGRIDVSIEIASDGWEISVQDNGLGIASEDFERIFEPFETARRPGQPNKNSGLGLAIVRKIVESHSGRVRVESELGAGSRFVVWLPRS